MRKDYRQGTARGSKARRMRGLKCEAAQIVITAGTAQALGLITRLLLPATMPPRTAIVEDPITYPIQAIFTSEGGQLYTVKVDEQGLCTWLLPPPHVIPKPALVMVTPSHQFPLGGILPVQRRIELIQYARQQACYLVEDDYDSEFRYSGPPLSALHSLAPDQVIYLGTFSKTLAPALRLGYMVLPPALVERSREIRQAFDIHSPTLDQLVLAAFIEEGHLERHIRRLRKVYQKRRETLVTSLRANFTRTELILHGDAVGLHLVAEFPQLEFTAEVLTQLSEAGIIVYPVEKHTIQKGYHRSKIILGFGNLTEAEIRLGVSHLKQWYSLAVSG